MTARCNKHDYPTPDAGTYDKLRAPHNVPADDCTCGIYALKEYAEALAMCYLSYDCIVGEVNLWGKVREHQLGYRAQYAYPKCFLIPESLLPSARQQIVEHYLKGLVTYGVDIYALSATMDDPMYAYASEVVTYDNPVKILLWTKKLGLEMRGIQKLQESNDLKSLTSPGLKNFKRLLHRDEEL